MPNPAWSRAAKESADPRRARLFFDQLLAASPAANLAALQPEPCRILASLLAGSQALSELLVAHPDWLPVLLDTDALRHPRQAQGLRREIETWLNPLLDNRDYAAALTRLRQFKQREMLRVAARDLARLSNLEDIILEISDIADASVSCVYRILRRQFDERLGQPWHQDTGGRWHPTGFCVFGMGKLGGQELNYSSDIDLIFVYSDEGHVFREKPGRTATARGLPTHQFFQRFIEAFVAELVRSTADGALYRVDLRLRPEGDTGPLARSLESYENYYSQWGQTWERMMLIKARCVAGDPDLAAEFLDMVQPFRYPRSIPERALQEIAGMKQRIETEIVRAGEIDRNVKLGRGGIREIEFVTQSLQLLNAGRLPFLQSPRTLPTLAKMVQYDLLDADDARSLTHAYTFLRDVEHRLQMENNLQTHTIPEDTHARERLATLMGSPSLATFETTLASHTRRVRSLYVNLVRVQPDSPQLPIPPAFADCEADWKALLARHAFTQVDRSLAVLRTFVEGPGYVHVSPRTVDLARQLLLRLLSLCPNHDPHGAHHWPPNPLSDPDRVLARLDSYVAAYGSRAMLYETWASNPSLFELLVLLFDRSEFLAETAIRTPDLVEDLMLSGQLRRLKSADVVLHELRHGAADADQRLWLRRYHQAEFMRLGLRDILGLADFEQNLAELSGLADACLQYALEAVMRRHRLKKPPFAILGLGKLGGTELTYGSDLDITFVADDKTRNLPALQRVAAEVMDMLSSPTEFGVAFQTDARLRPDGAKGLLVNTLAAYEDYYRRRAMLWEIQSISRSRPIAGNPDVGRRFCDLAASLSNFSKPQPQVAAFKPDWLSEIDRMRSRIEKERTPAGKNPLAFKTGSGGLIDAEFIAQALTMTHGWHEPNTLKALERARLSLALDPANATLLIDHYRKLLRIEGILRRWSFAGEAQLPDDPAPLYRVAVRCGFHDADSFLADVTAHRNAIRQAYQKVFRPESRS